MLHKSEGMQLRLLRISDGLTQEQLAEKLNVSNNRISTIETGSRKGSLEFYKNAAKYFNVTLDYFFSENIIIENNAMIDAVVRKMKRMCEEEQQFVLNIVKDFNSYKESK